MTTDLLYTREPVAVVGGVPCFTVPDDYVENYERISGDHLAHHDTVGGNPWMAADHWNRIDDATSGIMLRYVSAGDSVVDLGVGLGRILSRFPYLDRAGCDISVGYLERTAQLGFPVCMARLEDLPYPDGRFDHALCTDVLEHVLDINRVVAEVLRIIRPGGVLFVRVPENEDLSPYLDASYPYRFVHLRSFTAATLELLFDRVFGCSVVETSTVAGELNAVIRKPSQTAP